MALIKKSRIVIDELIAKIEEATGVSANSYGPTANSTLGYSGTFNIPQLTIDSRGRITSAINRTIKLPAAPTVTNISGNAASATKATYVTDVKGEYNYNGTFVVPAGGTWAYICSTNFRSWGTGSSDGASWGGTCAGGTNIDVDSRGTACLAIRYK